MQDQDVAETKSLNPIVFRLGLVSFFADVASEMLYPITPIFMTTVLGASMTSVGLIEGIAEAIASLMKTFSGSWSDRISQRKPFIFAGYLLGALAKPLIGVSWSPWGVMFARGIDRTGKGLRSAPRDAMIADSVPFEKRGEAYGWHRGMDTLGAAVGPLCTILLLTSNPTDLRALYFWALIPGLLSVFIICTVREKKTVQQTKKWKNPLFLWKQLDKPFHHYVYVWGLFSLVNSSDVFLLMKAKSSGLSIETVILLYCGYNLIYAISSPWLGKLSDKIARKKLLIAGLLIFTFVYLGFGFANSAWHFWCLFLFYGLYMGATDGVGKALAIDFLPNDLHATGLGLIGTVTGFCTIFASLFAGILWDQFGSVYTFIYGAAGAMAAAIFFMFVNAQQVRKI